MIMSTRNVASKAATAFAAVLLAATVAHTASAATVAGLVDGKSIVWIDSDTQKVTGMVALEGGASLVGFDVRPSDGKLYGVTPDGAIVVVDAKTGKWEKKSQLSEKLPAGETIAVDFNPVADRLRIIASNGMSLRVNVEDGKATVDGSLRFADTDPNKGKSLKVTAVA